MRAVIRLIDRMLCLTGGIFEFSQAPEIILRLQLRTAPHAVNLGSMFITRGDSVLALHLWNERMPGLPVAGADFEWAVRLRRCFIRSLIEVAKLLQGNPRYANAHAIYGDSALLSVSDHTGGMQMLQRLGFTVLPYRRPLGRFGLFWENLLSWGVMWTYNHPSLRTRQFWRLQRTELWMTRADFLRRFGQAELNDFPRIMKS